MRLHSWKQQVDLSNATLEKRLVKVTVMLMKEGSTEIKAKAERIVQVNPNSQETARMALHLKQPEIWSVEKPNSYQVWATGAEYPVPSVQHFVKNEAEYR